jgi:hypothetical protein
MPTFLATTIIAGWFIWFSAAKVHTSSTLKYSLSFLICHFTKATSSSVSSANLNAALDNADSGVNAAVMKVLSSITTSYCIFSRAEFDGLVGLNFMGAILHSKLHHEHGKAIQH